MTRPRPNATIPGMFRRKRAQEGSQQSAAPAEPTQQTSGGGYVSSELPTFHGRKRKVVVYTSDASGRIIKTIKKG